MSKKIDKSYHLRRLNIALTGAICLVILYGAVRPIITNATVQFFDGKEQTVSMPFEYTVFPSPHYTVRLDMYRTRFSPTVFQLIPDNCIDTLEINGTIVEEVTYLCTDKSGEKVQLAAYLKTGQNTMKIQMRDKGWYTGLNIRSSAFDPMNILLIVLLLALIRWYALPYYDHKSKYSLERLFHVMPKKKRLVVSHILTASIGLVVFYCIYIAMLKLGTRVAYELAGPYTVDTPLYWTVGRGILNGLVPYVDLFETKPPGIFLISAFSLWMTDSFIIGHWLQAFCILGIPFLVASIASFESRKLDKRSHLLYIAVGLLFGVLITLYTAQRSGEFQVESFGAFFATLYVWVIARARKSFSRKQFAMATFAILASVGLKEPFILPILASSILLNRTWAHTRDRFIKPFALAAAIGLILMILLGYLIPYVTIYLDEMFGRHIVSHRPLMSRVMDFPRIIRDIIDYSSYLYYALYLCIGVVFMHHRKHFHMTESIIQILKLAAVIFLLSLSIGIGGHYWNHHFAFAIPGYIAIAIMALRSLRQHWYRKSAKMFLMAFLAISAVGVSKIHQPDFLGSVMDGHNGHRDTSIRSAEGIDLILDACGLDTYMFLGTNGSHPYAYTKHSPMGPIFFQFSYFTNDERPKFQESFLHNLRTADLMVESKILSDGLYQEIRDTLSIEMSQKPWDCAGTYPQLVDGQYRLHFRQNHMLSELKRPTVY